MSDPSASSSASPNWSSDRFFQTQSAPPNLAKVSASASDFVQRHINQARPVVLVTSGGTTVPLEKNVVRFLDNFSAGTRGATSAEYFLSAGYAVIFMSRQHSLAPYTRHYSHTTNPFLDLLADPATHVHTDSPASGTGEDDITVLKQHVAHLRPILSAYHHARTSGLLHTVPFVTVNDYLWLLREMSRVMQPLGRNGMYYLAAAVSDFFIPSTNVPEHKIQSGKGSLVIQMDQVPKVLKPMVEQWVPEGYLVSFKLETDPKLLIPKAVAALQRYGHQLVIGNDLNRRKFEVVFVERDSNNTCSPSTSQTQPQRPIDRVNVDGQHFTATWTRLSDSVTEGGGKGGEKELEEDIIRELCTRHQQWIAKATPTASRF
ncbi:related to CAB2-probable phosphopantothenoylcysteine synthetase [Ustilago bromivora]|uniref:Related to CAB2 - probable phosphopantothenoylcysteine synthetase n=1 Tax=Ustilago bromivora TaxID=307758 RepID=A0A1K0G9E8_9BASI|nr:related to CAB2-probable phosphopantothenoylcysteine synthetase [Ustilago bromivora]SYW75985.1 related to CAB2 - probable phosphopantothenoylcysteine synthetase [Ustilago bromivora]